MSNDPMNSGAMLDDARKLNSDLGRHVRHCSFSTNLSGRFYQNSSMQLHVARAHRIAQMKGKRNQLEKSLLLEEKKIQFLEEQLRKKIEERRQEGEMKLLMEWSATKIQSHVRRVLAIGRVEVMTIEGHIVNYVVEFIQAMFRGRRERRHVHNLRLRIAQHRKEQFASIQIQSLRRRIAARRELIKRRRKMEMVLNNATCRIQACARGKSSRNVTMKTRRDLAAIRIQSMYRVMMARRDRYARKRALRKKKEKPERIPLHERRYSTYSMDGKKSDSLRRFTELSTNVSIQQYNEGRRRSSDVSIQQCNEGVRRSSLAGLEIIRAAHAATSPHEILQRPQPLPNQAQNDTVSISSSTTDGEGDKIRQARQRASIRAARQKKEGLKDKEKKLQRELTRKEELDRLEEKRRAILKQEVDAKKVMKNKVKAKAKASDESTDSASNNRVCAAKEQENGVLSDESKIKGSTATAEDASNVSQQGHSPRRRNLGIEMDFSCLDDDFDDDCIENEDDLA